MQELKQGTQLQGGKYVIKRMLGQGGFGITYLAEQISLGREVAIKEFFMKDSCVRDKETGGVTVPTTGSATQVEQYRKKFLKEARTLASLDHPYIVSVIDVWEENGTVYYSMPYLPGGSLKDMVSQNGPVPEHDALNFISQIAKALKHMHQERHICHYDVKPANILLDYEGNAKLIDFGISKNYDAEGNETSTTPIGLTQGFAPLEQYDGIKDFSPASDVYALGATLYFLLTGDVPPSALELVQENISLNFDANISEQTKALVRQAMAPATRKRPQSVDCFLQPQSTAIPLQSSDETITVPPEELTPQDTNSVMKPRLHQTRKLKYLKIGGFACFIVAIIAGLSWWTMQNDTIAIKWLQIRAELGNVEAQYNLSRCYYQGEGVKKDDAEAAKWCRKAAEQGNDDAQYNLATFFENGTGVEKNYTEAAKWYFRAAEQGNSDAQFNLAICYEEGKGVEKNAAEAVKWYLKAAEQGDVGAQNNLGLCYEEGKGVEKNAAEAVKWYLKAAEQGYAIAQNSLGLCYALGYGVKENHTEAVNWYRKAAEQGEEGALINLARCYEIGEGVEKDETEAVKWYRKAAEQGFHQGQLDLARCYEEGIGVAKNKAEAVKWYRKVAEQLDMTLEETLEVFGVSE